MPVKRNCVKYLTKTVNCLHAVKIDEIRLKKYIFSEKLAFQTSRIINSELTTLYSKCISQILLGSFIYSRDHCDILYVILI